MGNVYASSVLPCPLSLEILHVGFAETAAPNTNTQMDKYLQKSISRWDFLDCCSLNFTLPYSVRGIKSDDINCNIKKGSAKYEQHDGCEIWREWQK